MMKISGVLTTYAQAFLPRCIAGLSILLACLLLMTILPLMLGSVQADALTSA
jgi:hypothetical protein